MNRTTTWNRIGTDITSATSASEALKMAGLDYEVEKVPVFLENGFKVPGYFATKVVNSERTLGIVGSDYTVVQNNEAFDFINSVIPEGLEFVKAGETKKGIYIITKLPSHYILGDEVTPYLILQNSHNGKCSLRSAICPLRIVCQNQFARSFRESSNTISLRHSVNIQGKMEEAAQVLSLSATYMDLFNKEAEELAAKKIPEANALALIDNYFKIPEEATDRKADNIQAKKLMMLNAYNAEDNQNFKGTAWGLVNAFTDFNTHKEVKDTELSANRNFLKVTMDTRLLDQFIDMVKSYT